jgi:dihydropteroate synthase
MFTLNCKGRLLTVDNPLVMGIINITPDSFFEGSRFMENAVILKVAEKMLNEGADILDLGAQSTRPGSERISADEELKRLMPAVEAIHAEFPDALLSIDTYHSKVAKQTIDAGAAIVNDISAGELDNEMMTTVALLNVPYICMHMKGSPENMQSHAHYDNLPLEILDYFIKKIDACKKAGIRDIILDPGFGFGKTISHNFELLKNLSTFKILDRPILTGISRKSTIYKTLGVSAAEALNGTTFLHAIALLNGANILRVHDVKEAKEAVKLFIEYSK